jgi:DNA repair protein RecO (recombination protein O)
MSVSDRLRLDDQPAYVLHSYPFRETSLVVEVFTRHHGRVALVARGARRPRSAVRGVLLAFQPLLLSWYGKNELRTLHKAEWQGGMPQLQGRALICGFYLNELLLKLTAREDPHETLFERYTETLRELGATENHAAVLRGFERRLLQELGYGLILGRDAETGELIQPEEHYRYELEHGPIRWDGEGNGVQLRGKTLLDMAADDYSDPITQQQSKWLMRALINHHLGEHTLHTRQLLRDLQEL